MSDAPEAIDPDVFQRVLLMLKRYPVYFGQWPTGAMTSTEIHALLSAAAIQTAIHRIVPPRNDDYHSVLDEEGIPIHISEKMRAEVIFLRDVLLQQCCTAWGYSP